MKVLIRPGISRVVVEIVMLVVVVVIALLIFSPLGGYIVSSLAKVHSSTGSKFGLQVISVTPNGQVPSWSWNNVGGNPYCPAGTRALVVYVKNTGSQPISHEQWEESWDVFVKNSSGTFRLSKICWADTLTVGDTNPDMTPGEVWVLYFPDGVQDPSHEFSVIIYGPEGISSMYIYVPH